MSAAVTTALTPGRASALDASIERMRACACGERITLPHSMPGIAMSAPYWARPVTFGTPSGRIGRVPTHLNPLGEMSFIAVSVVALHGLFSAYRLAARAEKQNRRPEAPVGSLSSRASSFRRQDRGVSSVPYEGTLLCVFRHPDLGVKKLSKPPCYNALISDNLLIFHTLSVPLAFFTLLSRGKQGPAGPAGSLLGRTPSREPRDPKYAAPPAVGTGDKRGVDAQARSQSRFPGRRVGNPFLAGDQGNAEGDAADRRQAAHSLRGRGGQGCGDRAILLCHQSRQECHRRSLRPRLRARGYLARARQGRRARRARSAAARARADRLYPAAEPARARACGLVCARARRRRALCRVAGRRPDGLRSALPRPDGRSL